MAAVPVRELFGRSKVTAVVKHDDDNDDATDEPAATEGIALEDLAEGPEANGKGSIRHHVHPTFFSLPLWSESEVHLL